MLPLIFVTDGLYICKFIIELNRYKPKEKQALNIYKSTLLFFDE